MARHDELTNAPASRSDQPMNTSASRSELPANTSATRSEHVRSKSPTPGLSSRPSRPSSPPAGPSDPLLTAEKWDPPLYKSGKNKGMVSTCTKRLENTF